MTIYSPDRLPERIAAKITVNPVTGCWEWQGSRDKGGYGQIKWERRVLRVHRVVFELLEGPIPDGAWIDHVHARGCRSRACCWPAHLEPVTPLENTLRGDLPLTGWEPPVSVRDEIRALRLEVAELRYLLRDVAARLPLPGSAAATTADLQEHSSAADPATGMPSMTCAVAVAAESASSR